MTKKATTRLKESGSLHEREAIGLTEIFSRGIVQVECNRGLWTIEKQQQRLRLDKEVKYRFEGSKTDYTKKTIERKFY